MGELEAGSQLTKQRGHSLLIRTIATNIATPKATNKRRAYFLDIPTMRAISLAGVLLGRLSTKRYLL